MSIENKQPAILFFGTPDFALVSLQALCRAGFRVCGVVTQPDKPSGRGQQLTPPPTKAWALSTKIPVFQPSSLRGFFLEPNGVYRGLPGDEGERFTRFLNEQGRPDLLVVVAYGKILPRAVLELPVVAPINVHGSLLPRWRGAAPIQRALLAGDSETGVCIMKMEEGLDTGPVYSSERLAISAEDTFATLHDKLAACGADLLVHTLPRVLGGLLPSPQGDEGVSYAQKWDKTDSLIRWDENAEIIVNRVRASTPFPGARATLGGEVVKLSGVSVVRDRLSGSWEHGTLVAVSPSDIVVAAGNGSFVAIREMQFPGRKRLPVAEILKGRVIAVGERFTTS